jgi:hypothetical protein
MTVRPHAAIAGASLLVLALAAAPVAAQIVVGYPGPVWSRGTYDVSASVRIDTKPHETEVYVDGYYAGKVDEFDGTFQRLRVQPGDHEITLFHPGYRLFSQTVYLQPGNTFKIRHAMEKLESGEPEPRKPVAAPRGSGGGPLGPPPAGRGRGTGPAEPTGASAREPLTSGYGSVSIRVLPGDADVFVDGNHWDGPGEERLQIRLATGVHRIEVRKSGYRGYLTEVTIREDEAAPLNVALTKEP